MTRVGTPPKYYMEKKKNIIHYYECISHSYPNVIWYLRSLCDDVTGGSSIGWSPTSFMISGFSSTDIFCPNYAPNSTELFIRADSFSPNKKRRIIIGGFRNGAEICAKAISWLSAILHDVTFWVDYWRIIMLFWVMRDVGFCCGLLCWLILLCENSAFVVNRVLIASVFDLPLPQNFKGGFSCRFWSYCILFLGTFD